MLAKKPLFYLPAQEAHALAMVRDKFKLPAKTPASHLIGEVDILVATYFSQILNFSICGASKFDTGTECEAKAKEV
jgi:hypothetical protein